MEYNDKVQWTEEENRKIKLLCKIYNNRIPYGITRWLTKDAFANKTTKQIINKIHYCRKNVVSSSKKIIKWTEEENEKIEKMYKEHKNSKKEFIKVMGEIFLNKSKTQIRNKINYYEQNLSKKLKKGNENLQKLYKNINCSISYMDELLLNNVNYFDEIGDFWTTY